MLLKVMRWVVIAWTGAFVLLIVPVVSLYERNVSKWPVVTAVISNTHSEWVRAKGGGYYSLFATLDYDRPSGTSQIHCRLEHFAIGQPGADTANLKTLRIAARPYSCEEPARLPLQTPMTLGQWLITYLASTVGFVLVTLLAAVLPKRRYITAIER